MKMPADSTSPIELSLVAPLSGVVVPLDFSLADYEAMQPEARRFAELEIPRVISLRGTTRPHASMS